jgi:hypothetical protein
MAAVPEEVDLILLLLWAVKEVLQVPASAAVLVVEAAVSVAAVAVVEVASVAVIAVVAVEEVSVAVMVAVAVEAADKIILSLLKKGLGDI